MYNIAKVAKGEILLFFNDVFDALCKVGSDVTLKLAHTEVQEACCGLRIICEERCGVA